YSGADVRPLLACNSYTAAEKQSLDAAFVAEMARYTTKRGKTVAAAAFLTGLDYCIPYSYEWLICDDPGYELVARYTRSGLFLNNVTEDVIKKCPNQPEVLHENVEYPAWGCMVPMHYRFKHNYLPNNPISGLEVLDEYENGFHCSSFLAWCFFNAGAITDVTLLDSTYANNYRVFPQTTEVDLAAGVGSIRIG